MGTKTIVLTDPSQIPNGYCQLISLAWFLYDYALTFGDEVQYIWCRRFRWSAVLFLSTRYFAGLLLVLSALSCTLQGFTNIECGMFDWFEGIGTFVLFFFVQVILQSRLYIIYNRSRKILLSNACFMALEGIICGIITAFYYGDTIPVIVPHGTLGSCFYERPRKFAAVWAAPLTFESYLAFLAVRKILKEHALELNTSSLMSLIVRDNIIYFLMVVLAMSVNFFIFAFKAGLNPGVSVITVVHAAGAVGGTRIILSLLRNADTTLHLSTESTHNGTVGRTTGTRIVFRGIRTAVFNAVDTDNVQPFDATPTTLNDAGALASASDTLGSAA